MRQARIVIRTEVWSDVCLIFAERNPVKMLKSTLCHLSCCELCLVILFKDVTRWDWTHMGLVTMYYATTKKCRRNFAVKTAFSPPEIGTLVHFNSLH